MKKSHYFILNVFLNDIEDLFSIYMSFHKFHIYICPILCDDDPYGG